MGWMSEAQIFKYFLLTGLLKYKYLNIIFTVDCCIYEAIFTAKKI